jgi:hypothetical protein
MPVLLAGNVLYTWAIIAASVALRSVRQVLVPRELLGRVTASWRLGSQAVTLAGAVMAGIAAATLGGDPRPVFAAAGSLTLITVTVAWLAGLRGQNATVTIVRTSRRPREPAPAIPAVHRGDRAPEGPGS